jgi:hypothetical protein
MYTSKILYFDLDKGKKHDYPVLLDYYGLSNINNNKNIDIIRGIYEGLKLKGIQPILLHLCFLTNRLDELIHKQYTYNKSKYYIDFLKNNIKIGDTALISIFDNYKNLVDENNQIIIEYFDIYNDDYCPSCNIIGFHTNKNSSEYTGVRDCIECCSIICKKCSFIKNEDEPWSKLCYKCENGTMFGITGKYGINKNIQNKINSHKKFDLIRFNNKGNIEVDDVLLLLNKQNNKCYVCNDNLETNNYEKFCCYQFSIDRIDNSKPHNKDNVLISCYFCNCRDFPLFDQPFKICKSGCHKIKRDDIKQTRTTILNDIKQKLILK